MGACMKMPWPQYLQLQCLLCQAQLTSVGSRLVLTTTLGRVHHHHHPLPLQLLGITVTDPGQFSWKPSSDSDHTMPLWWQSSVTVVPGQRLLSTCLHTTQQTGGCP